MIELNTKLLVTITGGKWHNVIINNVQKINNSSFNASNFDASINNVNLGKNDQILIGGAAIINIGNTIGGSMIIY